MEDGFDLIVLRWWTSHLSLSSKDQTTSQVSSKRNLESEISDLEDKVEISKYEERNISVKNQWNYLQIGLFRLWFQGG